MQMLKNVNANEVFEDINYMQNVFLAILSAINPNIIKQDIIASTFQISENNIIMQKHWCSDVGLLFQL